MKKLKDYNIKDAFDDYFVGILEFIDNNLFTFKVLDLCKDLKKKGFKSTSRLTVQNKINCLMYINLVCLSNTDHLHPMYKINYKTLEKFLKNNITITTKKKQLK